MNKFSFDKRSEFSFYFFYIYFKLLLPVEVKKGRVNILLTEFVWVVSKLLKFKPFLIGKRNYYETKFGKFFINPDLISTIAVSPSFERREINMLLDLIGKDVKSRKKILFVDVGAYFGLYTVIVGNKFKRYKNITILSFEPDTHYLSGPTFNLLKRNIEVNKLSRTKIYHTGLGETNSKKENKVGVKTKKLDSMVSGREIKKYDKVYMKIDVDGYERGVLLGGKEFIKNSKSLTLLIEDFVDNKIVRFLAGDFDFISKPSVYNSFWSKK